MKVVCFTGGLEDAWCAGTELLIAFFPRAVSTHKIYPSPVSHSEEVGSRMAYRREKFWFRSDAKEDRLEDIPCDFGTSRHVEQKHIEGFCVGIVELFQ